MFGVGFKTELFVCQRSPQGPWEQIALCYIIRFFYSQKYTCEIELYTSYLTLSNDNQLHVLISPAATSPLPSFPRYPTTRRIGLQGEIYDNSSCFLISLFL